MSSLHKAAQIDETIAIVAEEARNAGSERLGLAMLKAQLALG